MITTEQRDLAKRFCDYWEDAVRTGEVSKIDTAGKSWLEIMEDWAARENT